MKVVEWLAALAMLASSSVAQSTRPPSPRAARSVVGRFLRAELAGREGTPATELFGCKRGYDQGTDFVLVVTRASIVDVHSVPDTAWVRVFYVVLGRAFLGQHSTFEDSVRVDTVSFPVVRDSLGVVRIGCGLLEADHYSVATMGRFLGRLDAPSRRAWNKALAAGRRL